jgi:uncharacterized phage-associated protein
MSTKIHAKLAGMAREKQIASLVSPRKIRFDFDFDKFLAVIHYITTKDVPELTKYKICKLLFLADKFHTVRYGRPIIGDRYCALPHGPIPSHSLDLLNEFISTDDPASEGKQIQRMASIFDLDKTFAYPRFLSKKPLSSEESQALSKSDIEALDHVIRLYGQKGFYELESLTHLDYAYRKAAEELTDLSYEDFFVENPDAIAGALDEMIENHELKRAFPHRKQF